MHQGYFFIIFLLLTTNNTIGSGAQPNGDYQNFLDSFVRIDYLKEKYPNIDMKSLRFDAKRDGATAPYTMTIESGAAKWFCGTLLGGVTVISLTRFFSQNADKIDDWLKNFKYPASIATSTGAGPGGSVEIGMPWYGALLCIGLSYCVGKFL
jgi:hypothetical protein